jgi:hypothetical protein
VAAAAAPPAGELSKLKRTELQEQLRKRGLRFTGSKGDLEARLLAGWGRACCFKGRSSAWLQAQRISLTC